MLKLDSIAAPVARDVRMEPKASWKELLDNFAGWCAQCAAGAPAQPTILASAVDEKFLDFCRRNKVTLLLNNLLGVHIAKLPENLRAAIQQGAANAVAVRLSHEKELQRLQKEFKRTSTPFVCLKGPVFAHWWYAAPEMREYRDLDLLVPEREVTLAINCLIDAGYRMPANISPRRFDSIRRTQHAIPLSHPSGSHVDLHWRLVESQFGYRINMRSIWQRSVQTTVAGTEVTTLSPIDSVLFAAIHAEKNFWLELRTLCDSGLGLFRLGEENCAELLQRAGEQRLDKVLAVSILLTENLLRLTLPEPLTMFARAQGVEAIVESVRQHFASGSMPSEDEAAGTSMELRKGWIDKTRYVVGRLFIPHDDDWNVPIPDALFFLYYVYKPIKTGWRAVRAIFS